MIQQGATQLAESARPCLFVSRGPIRLLAHGSGVTRNSRSDACCVRPRSGPSKSLESVGKDAQTVPFRLGAGLLALDIREPSRLRRSLAVDDGFERMLAYQLIVTVSSNSQIQPSPGHRIHPYPASAPIVHPSQALLGSTSATRAQAAYCVGPQAEGVGEPSGSLEQRSALPILRQCASCRAVVFGSGLR